MLLIKKANINGTGTIADILIDENGKYKEISENITASDGTKVIEANSMMACPTFANTHMHFDKAYTSELWQKELDLQYGRDSGGRTAYPWCHTDPCNG